MAAKGIPIARGVSVALAALALGGEDSDAGMHGRQDTVRPCAGSS